MSEPQLRNPFRSEADAFRLLIIVIVAVTAVVAASALAGPWVGLIVALVLLAVAGRATYRWLRISVSERESGS